MKNRKTRTNTLILIISIVVALVMTGCGNPAATATATPVASQTTTPASKEATASASSEATPAEKMKLTWIVYNQFDNPIKEGTPNQKLIEERFNVELEIPDFDVHNQEQWTLYWASGNTADRIVSNNMANFSCASRRMLHGEEPV